MKLSKIGTATIAAAVLGISVLGSGQIASGETLAAISANPVAPLRAPAARTPTSILQSVSRENAMEMARSYLEYSAFSRLGLIKQLRYEGFSKADATYGADSTRANWYKQAARMAASYLDYSAFSRSGLIAQLKYEGFTTAQATYGAKSAGL